MRTAVLPKMVDMSTAAEGEAHPQTGDPTTRSQTELLIALGKSLHSSGVPAHRLEQTLDATAARLGVSINVMSLPTGLMMSVGEEAAPATMLLRVDAGVVHLERLSRLSTIAEHVACGALEPTEAKQQIDEEMLKPPRWGRSATIAAYVLSSAPFAVFFGGGWPEVLTSVCVGLAAGLLAVTIRRSSVSPRLFELTAAGAAAIISNVTYLTVDEFVGWIPLAAGLIILLPGLALVDAVDELAQGHLASGAARMAGVGVVLLAMAFGALLGLTIVLPEGTEPPAMETTPLPHWWVIPSLFVVSVGSLIRFRGNWDFLWVAMVGSAIALVGAELSAHWLGKFAGPFVAAFLLGSAANIYANIAHQPSQLLTVPGLALLVPGSFGVRSIAALLNEETTLGVDTAFYMFVAAMALVGGLLFSNVVVPELMPWNRRPPLRRVRRRSR